MEPRDVIPPVDLAQQEREPVSRPEPVIEPRWLDVDTAATIPLHDAACALPPGGAAPTAVHPSRSSPAIRSPGARPLVGEGGEVWLW